MRKTILSLLLCAPLLLALTACSRDPLAPQAEESRRMETAAPAPTAAAEELLDLPVPEPPAPEDRAPYNPLTGEDAEEGAAELRPYAVMINNIQVAQPQVGVSRADLVYELMEEGGITRMMAFFTDMAAVERVGSIRSARLYNVSVAQAYDAILVHAGGSDEALSYISGNGVQDIDSVRGKYTGDTFYRDESRQAHGVEHSLFAEGPLIVRSARDLGYAETHTSVYDETYGLRFDAGAAGQCTEPAGFVEVVYAGGKTTSFIYDEDAGLYTGYQYGGVYTDNNETPMTFTNVLVLEANTYLQADGLHLTINLTGTGSGYFCCGGRAVPIHWQRDGLGDSFHYTLEDGTPLSLGVGRTFVAVQQTGSYSGTTNIRAEQ